MDTDFLPQRTQRAQKILDCGGKRSATPLWHGTGKIPAQKRRRRCALPAHSMSPLRSLRSLRQIIFTTPRRNQPPAQAAAPFPPPCAETSGHTIRSTGCRWNIIPRPPVRRPRLDATLGCEASQDARPAAVGIFITVRMQAGKQIGHAAPCANFRLGENVTSLFCQSSFHLHQE